MTSDEIKLWIKIYSRTVSETLRKGIRYDSTYAAEEAKKAAELALANFRAALRSPDLSTPTPTQVKL